MFVENSHRLATLSQELQHGYLVDIFKLQFVEELLRFKSFLLENNAFSYLTLSQFNNSLQVCFVERDVYIQAIADVAHLHLTVPKTFSHQRHSLHVLLALHAQAIGYPTYSLQHLEQALKVPMDNGVAHTSEHKVTGNSGNVHHLFLFGLLTEW